MGRHFALVISVIAGCFVPRIPANAADLSRADTIKAGKQAAEVGDFNAVYHLGLPLAEKGDAEIQYGLSGVLLYYAEGIPIEGVPDGDRRKVGLMWLRKAVEGGWEPALEEIALFYRWGEKGLPRDAELSNCFTQAEGDHKRISACRAREHAKGYEQ